MLLLFDLLRLLRHEPFTMWMTAIRLVDHEGVWTDQFKTITNAEKETISKSLWSCYILFT